MTKKHFFFVALLSIAMGCSYAGEAKRVDKLAPFFRFREIYTGYPNDKTPADEAVRMGCQFCGESRPQDQKRLREIWNLGETYKRVQALHEWAKEIIGGKSDADDSTVINILTCLDCWTTTPVKGKGTKPKWDQHSCAIEYELGFSYLLQRCSSAKPLNSDSLRYFIDHLRGYMCWWKRANRWLHIVDSVNGDTSLVEKDEYPVLHNTLPDSGMPPSLHPGAWAHSVAAEKAYLDNKPLGGKKAWHRRENIYEAALESGMEQAPFRFHKTLPRVVVETYRLLQEARKGNRPTAKDLDVLTELAKKERDTAGEMAFAYTTRCKLVVQPEAQAWEPMDSADTPIYLMPDTSAPFLPQWEGVRINIERELTELDHLIKDISAVKDKLDALKIVVLEAGDKALPHGAWRVNLNTRGYDTYASHTEIDFSPSGAELVTISDKPSFPKDDPGLQKLAAEVELRLHRIMVGLASLEAQTTPGKSSPQLAAGIKQLAELLNQHHLWALMLNQSELHGISPQVYIGLVEHFRDAPELLQSFTSIPDAGLAYGIAKELGGGKPDAAAVARCMRAMMTVRSAYYGAGAFRGRFYVLSATPQQREKEARILVELAGQASPHSRHAAIQFLCYNGMTDLAEKLLGKNPKEGIQGVYTYTAYCMIKRALERNDPARAKKLADIMVQNPGSYSHPAGRLALALVAQAEGRGQEAERLRKDAVILAGIRTNNSYKPYSIAPVWMVLIDAGLLGDFERLWNNKCSKFFVMKMADTCAEKGRFEQAAYVTEKLLVENCKNCSSGAYALSQAEMVLLRLKSDYYYALDLTARNNPLGAQLLPPARQALQKYLGGGATASMDAMEKAARGKAATAPPQETIPQAPSSLDLLRERKGVHILSDAELGKQDLTSKSYTWHIQRKGKGVRKVEGSIVNGSYFIENPDLCWVSIRTEEGQDLMLMLHSLDPKDIDHIAEWQESNGFIPCLPDPANTSPYAFKPFVGRVTAMGEEKLHPGGKCIINGVELKGDGRYATFRKADGNTQKVYFAEMSPETRELVSAKAADIAPSGLNVVPTWEQAKTYAEQQKLTPCALFVGKPGSFHDTILQEEVINKPAAVSDLNASCALVLCFQQEDGQWDAEGQNILREMEERAPGIAADIKAGGFKVRILIQGRLEMAPALWPEKEPAEWEEFRKAIESQNTAAIADMLKANPGLHKIRFVGGAFSPLRLAAGKQKHRAFQALLDAGANPNERGTDGVPILADCVGRRGQSTDEAEALLKAGADPNVTVPSRYSSSAGHICMQTLFHKDCLLTLLRHGMNPDPATGQEPLAVLLSTRLEEGELLELLPVMEERGLDIRKHGPAIWRACERKNFSRILDYLKQRGVSPV